MTDNNDSLAFSDFAKATTLNEHSKFVNSLTLMIPILTYRLLIIEQIICYQVLLSRSPKFRYS